MKVFLLFLVLVCLLNFTLAMPTGDRKPVEKKRPKPESEKPKEKPLTAEEKEEKEKEREEKKRAARIVRKKDFRYVWQI